ncbi:MAG: TQO small subunit DoxD [Candidatus Nanohalobium sp.]
MGKMPEIPEHSYREYAKIALRVSMGWIFLTAGLSKLVEHGLAYPKASGYLSSAVPIATPKITLGFPEIIGLPGLLLVKAGTFLVEPLMQLLASAPFIGTLVVASELFIGLSLLLGLLTWLGSGLGAFMMLLFYYGNAEWSHGLLNSDAVYLILLISLIAFRAGENFSLDSYISEKIETDNRILKAFLGVR